MLGSYIGLFIGFLLIYLAIVNFMPRLIAEELSEKGVLHKGPWSPR